jgi:catalase
VKILAKAGIPLTLSPGEADPGLLIDGQEGTEANAQSFITAIGLHRHVERDRDPPLV